MKPKYTLINQILFLTKEFSKEVLTRSKLRNNFLTSRELRKLERYIQKKKEMLKRNTKDEKKVIDNKQFWKTIKPLISNKSVSRDSINLLEKEKIVK